MICPNLLDKKKEKAKNFSKKKNYKTNQKCHVRYHYRPTDLGGRIKFLTKYFG